MAVWNELPTFGLRKNESPKAVTNGLCILRISNVCVRSWRGGYQTKATSKFHMCKDRTNITNCKESPLKNGSDSLKKKAKVKIISHNFTRKLSEKNPDSKLMKAYMDAHVCSNVYTVQGGKAHSHYCHRAFCPICQRIQTAQNVKKFLPVMKYLASEGREFYFVTLTLQNCVTDDARVLRDFMRRCNRMWADGIRTKHKFRSLGISGVIKKECTYHVVKKDLFSFHYHFHIIVDSLEAAKYVVAQWKKLHGSTVADARFQKYKKIEDFENAAIEVFKYASKASVSKSKGRDGKKKIQINYKALDMIYTAMHGMQRMSSFGQFRTMIGDEALNDFRDEDLVLNIEGLNVEDGCYTWYMSVKDKVADWYNMETGEALCCYKVTRKDELLQDIYLDEDIFPNSG